ncbi:MAG: phosphatidylglycerophosphatase A [Alphaproteobacteria bacterium]
MRNALKYFLTFFGLGLWPKMPGTWGSLGAIPLGVILLYFGGPKAILTVALFLFFLSWLATRIYTADSTIKDPQEIVIDEVIGMLISMAFCHNDPILILLAFILFRLFDIFKIGPVRWAQNLSGNPWKESLGVILDDTLAGLYTGLIVYGVSCFR